MPDSVDLLVFRLTLYFLKGRKEQRPAIRHDTIMPDDEGLCKFRYLLK